MQTGKPLSFRVEVEYELDERKNWRSNESEEERLRKKNEEIGSIKAMTSVFTGAY